MRKIVFNDAFEISKIFGKLGIKFEKGLKTQEEIGADFVLKLMQNAYKAQEDVNAFLGSFFEMTGEQFGKLEMPEVVDKLEELKKNNDLKVFWSAVTKLMK